MMNHYFAILRNDYADNENRYCVHTQEGKHALSTLRKTERIAAINTNAATLRLMRSGHTKHPRSLGEKESA